MANIRERLRKDGSRAFTVQVRMAGFPARTATFRTRRAAERWATTIEADMVEGRHFRNVEARRRSLGEAIDRYLADEVPKKRDGSMHRINLPYWKEALGDKKLAEITPALIAEHRDKLARGTYQRAKPASKRSKVKGDPQRFPRAASTVDKYLACLSHVFTIARKEWHWISHNPMDGVGRLSKGIGGRVRYLSDDERKALLEQTVKDPVLHTFVVIALSTACRAGELLKLTWSNVDLKTGRILFQPKTTKNAQARAVTLYGEALRLLKEHAKVRELSGRVFVNQGGRRRARGLGVYDYSTPFKAALKAAGVVDFRFHDLRHSAATYLAQQGATEQQLRAIGGWKSNVVSRYVHLAADDAKVALERLAEKIVQ